MSWTSFKVSSEQECVESEMDIIEAQQRGSCAEGAEETVMRNDVEIISRTDACCRGGGA